MLLCFIFGSSSSIIFDLYNVAFSLHFFGRNSSSSILCAVINTALWSIFVEARLFVLAHFLVHLGDFLLGLLFLVIRLLLPALCSYGFE